MPIEAGTVAEALAQFSAESPAAVLLDIDLPDGSGLEVLRFRRYDWPGNVRELHNVIERTLILEDTDAITTEYLPGGLVAQPLRGGGTGSGNGGKPAQQFVLPSEGISLDDAELAFVRQTIERSGATRHGLLNC